MSVRTEETTSRVAHVEHRCAPTQRLALKDEAAGKAHRLIDETIAQQLLVHALGKAARQTDLDEALHANHRRDTTLDQEAYSQAVERSSGSTITRNQENQGRSVALGQLFEKNDQIFTRVERNTVVDRIFEH